jgi:flagella basal body P-ring formation protein FlgA
MIVRSFLLVFNLIITALSPAAFAATDAAQIRNSIEAHMEAYIQELAGQYGPSAQIKYQIAQLDPRLSMADCPQPLTTERKSNNPIGKVNLQVSCRQTALWSLYVPVEINLYRPVVCPISPIARGTEITASQLQLLQLDISKLSGSYFLQVEEVVGMQAKRLLQPDSPIIASHLQPPVLVKKGDAVVMTANSGSLTVKIPGIALKDGRHGEQISIRNTQSKRVVEARVTAPGQADVAL